MECPKCRDGNDNMESMGYGDMKCSECGHEIYAESDEDFHARLGIVIPKEEN